MPAVWTVPRPCRGALRKTLHHLMDCSTSGGEAKQWPTRPRHSWKLGRIPEADSVVFHCLPAHEQPVTAWLLDERRSSMPWQPLERLKIGVAFFTAASNSASIPGLTSICAISVIMTCPIKRKATLYHDCWLRKASAAVQRRQRQFLPDRNGKLALIGLIGPVPQPMGRARKFGAAALLRGRAAIPSPDLIDKHRARLRRDRGPRLCRRFCRGIPCDGLTDEIERPLGDDFINFWSGAFLKRHQRAAEIYNFGAFHAFEHGIVGGHLMKLSLQMLSDAGVDPAVLAFMPYIHLFWLAAGWFALHFALRMAKPPGRCLRWRRRLFRQFRRRAKWSLDGVVPRRRARLSRPAAGACGRFVGAVGLANRNSAF